MENHFNIWTNHIALWGAGYQKKGAVYQHPVIIVEIVSNGYYGGNCQ